MIKIVLLALITCFSVGVQAKVAIALSDQEIQALEEKKATAQEESAVDAKVSTDSTRTESSDDASDSL